MYWSTRSTARRAARGSRASNSGGHNLQWALSSARPAGARPAADATSAPLARGVHVRQVRAAVSSTRMPLSISGRVSEPIGGGRTDADHDHVARDPFAAGDDALDALVALEGGDAVPVRSARAGDGSRRSAGRFRRRAPSERRGRGLDGDHVQAERATRGGDLGADGQYRWRRRVADVRGRAARASAGRAGSAARQVRRCLVEAVRDGAGGINSAS